MNQNKICHNKLKKFKLEKYYLINEWCTCTRMETPKSKYCPSVSALTWRIYNQQKNIYEEDMVWKTLHHVSVLSPASFYKGVHQT